MESSKKTSNWCGKGVRPKFTVSEDQRLGQLVEKYGKKSWVSISKKMTNKTPKQCRERYENYVNPKITNSEWTEEEEQMLIHKYIELGPHWVKLSKQFKTRSVNNIRNKWLMLKRKNLLNFEPKTEKTDTADNDESNNSNKDTDEKNDNEEKEGKIGPLDKIDKAEELEGLKNFESIVSLPDFEIEQIEPPNGDLFGAARSEVADFPLYEAPRTEFELTLNENLYPFF